MVRATLNLQGSLEATQAKIHSNHAELWEAIDDEVQERKQESPLFKKLLDDRTDMIAEAVRASIDGLRDEMLSLIEPVAQLTEGWQRWGENIEAQLTTISARTDTLSLLELHWFHADVVL